MLNPHYSDPDYDPTVPPEPEGPPPAHHVTTFTTSPEVGELFGALAVAQGAMAHAEKSRINPAFKQGDSKGTPYATLADCISACRAPLSAANLAVMQPVKVGPGGVTVSSILGHSSGQWLRMDIAIPLGQVDAQKIGSAITYGRRYGLCALVGIAPDDDDDGGEATKAAPPARAPFSTSAKDRLTKSLHRLTAAKKVAGHKIDGKAPTAAGVLAELMGDRAIDNDDAADMASNLADAAYEAIRAEHTDGGSA